MWWTDNPAADAERYYCEQEKRREKLPKCDYCGEPILDEYYYDLGGDIMCQDCLDSQFKKNVEDFIE